MFKGVVPDYFSPVLHIWKKSGQNSPHGSKGGFRKYRRVTKKKQNIVRLHSIVVLRESCKLLTGVRFSVEAILQILYRRFFSVTIST